MLPRSLGRRLAAQYLYMVDLGGDADIDAFFRATAEADADGRQEAREIAEAREGRIVFRAESQPDATDDEARAFARELIGKATAERESLDRSLAVAAENWDVGRMAAVERNILRVAAAEFSLGATPRAVVIDEAVKLAKRFGGKDSGAFVNGVLDRLANE